MNNTEIIRRVCETARSRHSSPEDVEHVVRHLLSQVEPGRRDALRAEIDNAVAAIGREIKREGAALPMMTIRKRRSGFEEDPDLEPPAPAVSLKEMRVRLNRGNR